MAASTRHDICAVNNVRSGDTNVTPAAAWPPSGKISMVSSATELPWPSVNRWYNLHCSAPSTSAQVTFHSPCFSRTYGGFTSGADASTGNASSALFSVVSVVVSWAATGAASAKERAKIVDVIIFISFARIVKLWWF